MAVAIRIATKEEKVIKCQANVWGGDDSPVKTFVEELLSKKAIRKVVFAGKEFLATILDVFPKLHTILRSDFVLLDPKVGCWLLQPDRSPKSFKECALFLCPDLKLRPSGSVTRISEDLDILSSISERLFQVSHLDSTFY